MAYGAAAGAVPAARGPAATCRGDRQQGWETRLGRGWARPQIFSDAICNAYAIEQALFFISIPKELN